jgi:hypothetical protein
MDGEGLVMSVIEDHIACIHDAIWLLGQEWDFMSTDQTLRFQRFIESLLKKGILTKEQLLIHLDEPILMFCSLINSTEQLKKRQNIVRTKLM